MKSVAIISMLFASLASGHVVVRRQVSGSSSLSGSVSSPTGNLGLSGQGSGSLSPPAAAELQANGAITNNPLAGLAANLGSNLGNTLPGSTPSAPSNPFAGLAANLGSNFGNTLPGSISSASSNPLAGLAANLGSNLGNTQPGSISSAPPNPLATLAANLGSASGGLPRLPAFSGQGGVSLPGGDFGAGVSFPSLGMVFGDAASLLGNLVSRIHGEGLSAALGGIGAARNTLRNLAGQGKLAVDAGLGLGVDGIVGLQDSLKNYANYKLNLLNNGIRTAVDAGGSLAQTGLGLASLYPRFGLDMVGALGR